jgi:uncharacterized membrane protein
MVRDEILGLKILWVLVVIGMIIMALQWLYNQLIAIPIFIYNQLSTLPEVTWWILALIVLLILSGLLERHYQRTHND